ncbi:hypothetical protein PsYK624_163240 [Phanerochaete sordida]|uniref:Uncharacterized protein n=1 Tax=Phanerochaete sordida TaxID=48140 RepID=A0A9P3LLZ8_9APHY|nr:hypothetical protein PsYK624_163240 [Phanerochaete sordida]
MQHRASTEGTNASSGRHMRSRALPTEILHEIVSHAVASFFGEVVAGVLEYDWRKDKKLRRLTGLELRNALALEVTMRVEAEEKNDFTSSNPVDALLHTSYQLRHLALQVLTKVMGVSYAPGGLGRMDGLTLGPITLLRAFRRLLWAEKVNTRVRAGEAELVEYTSNTPALATCLSIAAIQREIITMREFGRCAAKMRELYHPALLPWLQEDPKRWIENAYQNLERCPEAIRDVLAPRVADAVVGARIETIFSFYFWDLNKTWDIIERSHRTLIREQSEGDLLAAVPEGLPGLEYRFTLRELIAQVTTRLHFIHDEYRALLELHKTVSPPRSLDEMIRPQHLRRYLCVLFDISAYGRIEGEEHKACRALASMFRAVIEERYDRVWYSAFDDPEEKDDDEAPVELA